MSDYVPGNLVECSGEFDDENGDPMDPDNVFFRYKNPAGAVVTLEFGVDVAVVQDSTGRYHANVDATTHGVWFYRWYSTGNGQGADEKSFTVRKSEF